MEAKPASTDPPSTYFPSPVDEDFDTGDDLTASLADDITDDDPLGWFLRHRDTSDLIDGWYIGDPADGLAPFPDLPRLGSLPAASVALAIARIWQGDFEELPLDLPAPFAIAGLDDSDDAHVILREAASLGVASARHRGIAWRRQAREMGADPTGEPLRALLEVPAGARPRIGGEGQTSFVVHSEPEQDGVEVSGDASSRAGIEIGIRAPGLDASGTAGLETLAAKIPMFLPGVWSELDDDAITIGWDDDDLDEQWLAQQWYAWLRALPGVEAVDLRVVFAPRHGRSTFLTQMRQRARAWKAFRAGEPYDVDEE